MKASEDEKLRNLGQTWNERSKYASTPTKDDKDLTVVSVRADGFVAWPSESEPNLTAVAKSIERRFADVTSGGTQISFESFHRGESGARDNSFIMSIIYLR